MMFGVEAYTVIAHVNLKTAVQALERNLCSASPGMAADVLKGLFEQFEKDKARSVVSARRDFLQSSNPLELTQA